MAGAVFAARFGAAAGFVSLGAAGLAALAAGRLLADLRVTIASSIGVRSLNHERAPLPYTGVNVTAA
jgi:hypothetical protein